MTDLSHANPLVELRHLSKSYTEGGRRRNVLQSLNAQIGAGEVVVILGRSGSGKSTLLNLISGIDVPDAGEVIINGQPLTRLGERERTLFRRQHIGFVFQFFNLIPTLSVEENVLLPLELNETLDNAQRQRARALLEEVGLGDRAHDYPDRLSGGEQQRVAIARALTHRPTLLLADEPTGNLDSDTSAQIVALMERLVRQDGTTAIIVTHSSDLIRIADRVFTFQDGKLRQTQARQATE